jgi:hypothetical protein
MSEENQVENQEAQDQQADQVGVDLTVQDLASLKTIIDVAAQRGAFKPGEMEAVGKVYNKLSGFLAKISKGQEQNG